MSKNLKSFLILLALILSSLVIVFTFKSLNKKPADILKLSPAPISTNYLYQSINQGFALYIGNRSSEQTPKIKFAVENASIDFSPAEKHPKSESVLFDNKDGKNVIYKNIYPGVDFKYSLIEKGVKEEIIINTEEARRKIIQEEYFLFEAMINKALLQEEKNNNGNLYFIDPQSKRKLFYIPQPFMIDGQGKKSEEIKFEFVPELDNGQKNEGKFNIKLIFDKKWLAEATLPIIIDPTIEISILNVHSHPQTGDNWEVSFQTQGIANLKITPNDQETIDDLEFISLTCNGQEKIPQILVNDVIFYPNWSCGETGKITHLVNVANHHTLKFQFGDQIAYAYNSPEFVTDYFDTNNPNSNPEYYIDSKTNLTVSGGQVKLTVSTKANGEVCSAGSECSSTYCVDSVCCNTACTGSTCQRCDSYSSAGSGTCGYISTAVDPDSECGTTGCYTDNCSGSGYACGYYTSDEHNCTTACTTCAGAISGSCVNMSDNTQDEEGGYTCSDTCKKCSSGACINQSNSEDLFDDCPANACNVILNSASDVSCATKCSSGLSTTTSGLCDDGGVCQATNCSACLGRGTDAAGTNNLYWRFAVGSCASSLGERCTCANACLNQSYVCNGYPSMWTYCRCGP